MAQAVRGAARGGRRCRAGAGHHRVVQGADALDLDPDDVAGAQELPARHTDPGGRARGDHVTRLERDPRAGRFDERPPPHEHVAHPLVLLHGVVDPEPQTLVVRVGEQPAGRDRGPHGAERVLRLGRQPVELERVVREVGPAVRPAGRDVVDHREARDVPGRVGRRDAPPALADDDAELALPVDLLGRVRVDLDGCARPDHGRGGRLQEEPRVPAGPGRSRAHLGHVRGVVHARADQLGRVPQRREELRVRNGGQVVGIEARELALQPVPVGHRGDQPAVVAGHGDHRAIGVPQRAERVGAVGAAVGAESPTRVGHAGTEANVSLPRKGCQHPCQPLASAISIC